jgi:hypothetical protein
VRLNVVGPCIVNAPFATELAFVFGLQQLGYQVTTFDPNVESPDVLDRDADFTIVFKTALQHNAVLKTLSHPVVLYQPDDIRFPHIKQMIREMREYSEHLITFRHISRTDDPDEWALIDDLGFKTREHLMVTAHPDVYHPPYEEVVKDIDFCFIGSIGDHSCHWQRLHMVNLLRSAGWRVLCGQTQDIDLILSSMARSRVVLNHASGTDIPFGVGQGYQCRHFEVGYTGAALLSNRIHGEGPANHGMRGIENFVRFDGDESLLQRAAELIHGSTWRDLGERLRREVRDNNSPFVRACQLTSILERI